MKEYALFLGCTIPLKFPHLEKAFREVLGKNGFRRTCRKW